jgi:thiol-activated cytolysin
MLEVREQQFSNKEIYVRGSGYENIYPGSIIYIDQDVTAGSPRTVGYLKRNKISIYGDFLAGTNTLQKDVEATNSSVRGASNNIMRILLADSRYEAPGRQQPKTEIYTSMKKLMMDFKVDASFAGIGVNVSAKTSSTEQKFIQATTFEQDYFTVKLTDSWKQDPSTLFADSVTWQDINAQLKGKAIAIVTSVTYGRTFSYMKEYSAKDFTYDGNQKVKGYGQEASSSQSLAESSSYSKDDVFNLGGTALSIAVLKSKKTQAELETAMADNMKFGHSNQGVVMKYTIQLITGDSPGRVVKPTYSGKYNEISYTRCPHNVEMHIKVTDVTIGAGKVKVQLDMEAFKVQNSKAVYLRKVDGNSSSKAQDAWFYTFSNSRNREYGDLKKGEYIYPNPLLRIRSKATGSGKYRADNSRRVDISSGKIRVELKGSVFAGKNVGIKSITEGLDAK